MMTIFFFLRDHDDNYKFYDYDIGKYNEINSEKTNNSSHLIKSNIIQPLTYAIYELKAQKQNL